jgi:predicted PurR-regulated permease PerM
VWAIIVASFDGIVRLISIKRNAELPLLLIFVGMMGGLLAFGIIGFIAGPVGRAVFYTLLVAW